VGGPKAKKACGCAEHPFFWGARRPKKKRGGRLEKRKNGRTNPGEGDGAQGNVIHLVGGVEAPVGSGRGEGWELYRKHLAHRIKTGAFRRKVEKIKKKKCRSRERGGGEREAAHQKLGRPANKKGRRKERKDRNINSGREKRSPTFPEPGNPKGGAEIKKLGLERKSLVQASLEVTWGEMQSNKKP